MKPLKVITDRVVSIGDIKPNPRNPRTHPDWQVERNVRSIETCGFTQPLLVDENLMLLAGEGGPAPSVETAGVRRAAVKIHKSTYIKGDQWSL